MSFGVVEWKLELVSGLLMLFSPEILVDPMLLLAGQFCCYGKMTAAFIQLTNQVGYIIVNAQCLGHYGYKPQLSLGVGRFIAVNLSAWTLTITYMYIIISHHNIISTERRSSQSLL